MFDLCFDGHRRRARILCGRGFGDIRQVGKDPRGNTCTENGQGYIFIEEVCVENRDHGGGCANNGGGHGRGANGRGANGRGANGRGANGRGANGRGANNGAGNDRGANNGAGNDRVVVG
jgi:hypothetical protein